jgi:large subunit ribosomal protein L1
MSHSKRFNELVKQAPTGKASIADALKFLKEKSNEKFDSTIELHVRLGIDPKQSDQTVRGSAALPAGSGKSQKVAAIVSEKHQAAAKAAGADIVAGEDLVEKIKDGKMDFDVLVASPDMMPKLGRVAKVLGPRGLMPNPKTETVGPDVGKLIKAIKAGKANFKNDEYGIVHLPVGKRSFSLEDLKKNVDTALDAIKAVKPDGTKGVYLKSVTLSATMSPGVRVSVSH